MTLKPPTRTLPKLVMKEWPERQPRTSEEFREVATHLKNTHAAPSMISQKRDLDAYTLANAMLDMADRLDMGKALSDFTLVVEETGILDQERSQKDGSR